MRHRKGIAYLIVAWACMNLMVVLGTTSWQSSPTIHAIFFIHSLCGAIGFAIAGVNRLEKKDTRNG